MFINKYIKNITGNVMLVNYMAGCFYVLNYYKLNVNGF